MTDLILAILFSAIIPILLNYAHRNRLSDEVVLTFNYTLAVIISFIMTMTNRSTYGLLFEDSLQVIILTVIGIITGLMFYGSFYYYQKSVKDHGVALSIAVGKMGVILPLLLSLVIWKELPTPNQWLGILISIIAIGLISIHPSKFQHSPLKISLLFFLIMNGLGDFFNNLFESTVGASYKDLFLCVVFGCALLASSIPTIKQKQINGKSVFFGFAIGLPNMLTTYFFINALSQLKDAVVFPLYSGGAIFLTSLWGILVFHERLKIKEAIGMIFILIALILINL